MGKSKVRTLVVIGNIAGVIAIIAIILLQNYNSKPVTVESDESDTEALEVSESAKSEPVMEAKKPIELRPTDSDKEDKKDKASEEEQKEDKESADDDKTNNTTENNTEETEQPAVTEQNTNAEQDEQQYQAEQESSSVPDKDKRESESSGVTNKPNKDEPADDESQEASDSGSEKEGQQESDNEKDKGIKCGESQEEKNGECVDQEPTYVEKVQNALPNYSITKDGEGKAGWVVSNSNGVIVGIDSNKQMIIRTKDTKLGHKVVDTLSSKGLATPK